MARTLTQPGPERANRLIFIGAVALAGLAAILVFAALANFGGGDDNAAVAGLGDTVDVVVASEDIGAGDEITEGSIELATLPVNVLVDDAFTDMAAVVGTRAQGRILAGDQLAPAKVVGAGDDDSGLSRVIPPGFRAASVSVTEETSVGGLILPGDRVDVIVAVEGDVDGVEYKRGVLLFQNVEVLAVAQETLRPVSRIDEDGEIITTDTADGVIATREDVEEDPEAASVTLALAPQDMPLLALAEAEGTIYLVLRPVGDDSTTDQTIQELPR
jgi:pilus assembly protein CpaB